ncbi:ArsR family transcriptional regulator [bacterium]|nr:MAG: ArsR family transcriptional regulator [bacterium]
MLEQPTCCTPAVRGEVRTAIRDSDAEFARLAAALGHPARVAIVRFLKEKGVCICGEIVEVLPLAQSTVSQHLKTLKEAGLVQGETDGPRSCYCLNPAVLDRLKVLLGEL